MAVTAFFQSLEQWRQQTKRDPKHGFRVDHKRKHAPASIAPGPDATIILLALQVAAQHGSQHLRSRYQQLADEVEGMLDSVSAGTST